jgi:hypothetical protein
VSEINKSEAWEENSLGSTSLLLEQAEGVFMLQMAHVPNSDLASNGIEGCVTNFMEHSAPREVSELISEKKTFL